jgi:hypothetical protein
MPAINDRGIFSMRDMTRTAFTMEQLSKHFPPEMNARNNISGVFYVVRAATVAMQRRGKHVSSIIERPCFLLYPCRSVILKTIGATVRLRIQLWSVNQMATEVEDSLLIRVVTMKLLVKTLQRNSHCLELLPSND